MITKEEREKADELIEKIKNITQMILWLEHDEAQIEIDSKPHHINIHQKIIFNQTIEPGNLGLKRLVLLYLRDICRGTERQLGDIISDASEISRGIYEKEKRNCRSASG